MKKRTRNKLLAIATAILLAAVMVVPGIGGRKVNATPIKYSSTDRADTSLENTEFSKNLQIRNDCNIPESTFKFVIEPGQELTPAQAVTDGTLAVIPGIIPGLKMKSKIGGIETTVSADENATEVSADVVYAAQNKSGTIGDDVTIVETFPDTNHYTATKIMGLDFTGVKFTEPGVYRYYITESDTINNIGVSNDPNPYRTLDVYVEDAKEMTTGTTPLYKLKITKYVLYKGKLTKGPSNNTDPATDVVDDNTKLEDGVTSKHTNGREVAQAEKSVGFINKYPTASLTFGKEVTGNQGSRDKYFKFNLVITEAPENTIFGVNLQNAEIHIAQNPNTATTCITAAGGVDNPTTLTAEKDSSDNNKIKAKGTFYLQDGQYITVYGFAEGMHYELTEEAEDYKSIEKISADESSLDYDDTHAGCDALSGETSGEFTATSGEVNSKYTGFTNDRSGVIPTGVILSVAPWAIAGVVILAGVVFFAIRSRKKYEEE